MGINKDDSNVDDFKEVERLKEILDKQYADFVILGYDKNEEFASCVNVGIEHENSISNRDRINEMIGQIEIFKYNLIPNTDKIICKCDNDFFNFFQKEAFVFFGDYIVIAVDILGDIYTSFYINQNKKAKLIGDLEETKIQLIAGIMGFINLDNEDNNQNDNENNW